MRSRSEATVRLFCRFPRKRSCTYRNYRLLKVTTSARPATVEAALGAPPGRNRHHRYRWARPAEQSVPVRALRGRRRVLGAAAGASQLLGGVAVESRARQAAFGGDEYRFQRTQQPAE